MKTNVATDILMLHMNWKSRPIMNFSQINNPHQNIQNFLRSKIVIFWVYQVIDQSDDILSVTDRLLHFTRTCGNKISCKRHCQHIFENWGFSGKVAKSRTNSIIIQKYDQVSHVLSRLVHSTASLKNNIRFIQIWYWS